MKAIEKIFLHLLLFPGRRWTQVEIAKKCCCSKAFLSKTCKRLLEKGLIARPYKNQVVLVNFLGLLNEWAKVRKLPEPIFVESRMPKEQVMQKLKKMKGYALTAFSAAWLRAKYLETNSIELYVKQDAMEEFIKAFGKKADSKTNFVIFPVKEGVEGIEKIAGLNTVSAVQNYVDLMVYGGNGIRVALNLAEKLGWVA